MELWRHYLTNEGRTIHKWHHYFSAYDVHFPRFQSRPCLFWEIGVGQGGSLQMLKTYLGPHAHLVGIDIAPQKRAIEEEQVAIRIGDQSDEQFLAGLIDEFGVPDVIVDDGSHQVDDVCNSFRYLYPRMSKTGVYFIEDVYTAYWPNCGGSLHCEGSIIEVAKNLIDELNAELSRGAVAPTEFTSSTMSMHFYPGLIVFERGPSDPKVSERIPNNAPTGISARVHRLRGRVYKIRHYSDLRPAGGSGPGPTRASGDGNSPVLFF